MDDVEKYWQGWNEAVSVIEKRLSALISDIDSHTKPVDLALDMRNELKELKISEMDLQEFTNG